jgi:hypothetical protein
LADLPVICGWAPTTLSFRPRQSRVEESAFLPPKAARCESSAKKNGSFDALRLLRMTYDYIRFPVGAPARSRKVLGGLKTLSYKSCEKFFAAAAYFIPNVHKIVIDRPPKSAMIYLQKIGLAIGKIF